MSAATPEEYVASRLKLLHDDLARMEVALSFPEEAGGTAAAQSVVSKSLTEMPGHLRALKQSAAASSLQIPLAAMKAVETPGQSNPDMWLQKTLAYARVAYACGKVAADTSMQAAEAMVTVVFLSFSMADLYIKFKRYWGRWLVRTCSLTLLSPLPVAETSP